MNHIVAVYITIVLSTCSIGLGFDCPLPGEEETFYPDPTDCSKYIECYAGKESTMNCPGDLYWNQEMQYCDYPANVQCNIDPTASTVSTTPKSTTKGPSTTPGSTTTFIPDQGCPYPSDIVTYDYYPGNCSAFYECDHGRRYLMTCPPNYLWNHILNYCDFPENVDCTRTTTTTHAPTGSTTTSPICIGQPDGEFFPNINDCSKYYECLSNHAYEHTCPANTLWDQSKLTCDWAYNVKCTVTTPATI